MTLCLFFGNINAQSIDSKPFRVDAMVGLGASKSSINWLFSLEPKYKLNVNNGFNLKKVQLGLGCPLQFHSN